MSWRRFLRRKHWDEVRTAELQAYLEIETEENVSRGMPAAEARYAALRKLGNPTLIREETYLMNSIGFIETLWQDLRYGLRVLRKSPGFALVAVLSLALGIGANTAAFSVIHGVLLRSLPYPEPNQLVRVGQRPNHNDISIPEYEFWKEHASGFASAAGYRGGGDRNLVFGARQEWIRVITVTADFFRTLGTPPALGREFDAVETNPAGPQAIVLSDSLWRRAFSGDPAVLGRVVALDNTSYTVVGVLPSGFWFPQSADAFLPLRPTGSLGDRGSNTEMIARLKPGVSLRQAEAEMPTITENYRRAHSDVSREYRGLSLVPYQDWLVGDVRPNLLLLFGAVGLLLLIACSNLASLLLARLAARQREIALRLALGSSRARLVRQFLIENLLLTSAGGLAGLFGARALLAVLVALIPFNLPASAPIRLDAPVLAFTLAVAFITGLAFSLAPILTASRVDVQEALKGGGRSTGARSRQWTRSLLVVGEVALSVTLLIGAGLLIQSLYRLHQERLGFTPQGLITFGTPIAPERRRSAADLWRLESTLLDRFQALPGVRSVAAINVLPLNGFSNLPAQLDGHPEKSIGPMEIRFITPAYFEAMGIPVLRGRSILGSDTGSAPPVILVNETLARRWWPDASPLGNRIVIGRYQGRDFSEILDAPREVVGVAADTKTAYLKERPRPTVYVPGAQISNGMAQGMGGMAWVVRGSLSAGLAAELRQAIAEIDPRQRVGRIRPMEEIVASTTSVSRFDASLFAFLAGLALVLTLIGVYGLLSFSVAQRTNEIGVRMALGASRADVLKLVLKQGVALIAIGLVLGLAGALATTRFLTTLLFGVRPTDPLSFLAVSALLLCVGILASYFPARRATKVDPLVALRYE
jgi:putative ABC transport system permease protein